MASGPFVWGPAQGVPIWMPYSPYLQSPIASPYASPYASAYPSPYTSPAAAGPQTLYTPSPFYPQASLWPGTPFAAPYAPLSPVGLAAPNTLGLAAPYTPPSGPSPNGGTASLPASAPPSPPPAPPAPPQEVHVAPWLMYNPRDPRPAIRWDVAADPATARQWSAKLWRLVPLAPQFDERATYPGAADGLRLVVDGADAVLAVYGAIDVPGADPSVGDVLAAVHAFFQRRMSKDDVEKAKALRDGNWERMIAAMAARCRRAPGLPEYEWAQGLRRVDLLDEKTAWGGLQVEYTPDGAWQLRLMLADPPAEDA